MHQIQFLALDEDAEFGLLTEADRHLMAVIVCYDKERRLPGEISGGAWCTPQSQISEHQSLGIDFGGASELLKSFTTDKTDHLLFVPCKDKGGQLPEDLVGDAWCRPPSQIAEHQSLDIDFGGASEVLNSLDTKSFTTDKTDHLAIVACNDKEGRLTGDLVGDAWCSPPSQIAQQHSLNIDFGTASVVFKSLATGLFTRDEADHLAVVACNVKERRLPGEIGSGAFLTPPPQTSKQQSLGIDFGAASVVFKSLGKETF